MPSFAPNTIEIIPYDGRTDLYDWMQTVFEELEARGILHHIKGTPSETAQPALPPWDAPQCELDDYLQWQRQDSEAMIVILRALDFSVVMEIGMIEVKDTALDVVKKIVERWPPSRSIFDPPRSQQTSALTEHSGFPDDQHWLHDEGAYTPMSPIEPMPSVPPSRSQIVQQIEELYLRPPGSATDEMRLEYWYRLLDMYDKIRMEEGEEKILLKRNPLLTGLLNEYTPLRDESPTQSDGELQDEYASNSSSEYGLADLFEVPIEDQMRPPEPTASSV